MTRMCGRRPRHSLNLADPLLVAARPAPATLQDGVAHRRLRSLVLQSPPPPLPARRRRARALQQLRHRLAARPAQLRRAEALLDRPQRLPWVEAGATRKTASQPCRSGPRRAHARPDSATC